jgi:hypothetical protein
MTKQVRHKIVIPETYRQLGTRPEILTDTEVADLYERGAPYDVLPDDVAKAGYPAVEIRTLLLATSASLSGGEFTIVKKGGTATFITASGMEALLPARKISYILIL